MSLDLVALPKIELHVHFEGTLPAVLVRELARRHGRAADVGPMEWMQPGYRWPGPKQWLASMHRISDACIRTIADYEMLVSSYVKRLAQEGVIYAEPSVAIARARALGLNEEAVLGAVCEFSATTSEEAGIDIGVIVAVDYLSTPEDVMRQVELAIAFRPEGVVGIDLHGPPVTPLTNFVPAFARARSAGLGTRAHAGEVQGAGSVARAIDVLGVTRIAHGVRAIEDAALVDRLRRDRVALDLCPSSNVALGIVPSLEAHPVRRLYNAGVAVSVSSDDPLYFQTHATREYALLRDVHGFSTADLLAISAMAAEHSFAPPDVRARLAARLERAQASVEPRPSAQQPAGLPS